MTSELSRRRFLEVVAASAAAGIALPATGSSPAVVSAGTVLTSDEMNALTAVLNRLIPASGQMPGAGDLGIAVFIDRALSAAPHLKPHLASVLAATGRIESPADLDAVMQRLEHEQADSFDTLVQAAYTGYYSHADVLSALGWSDPEESAHQLPPFDVTLLAAVRRRAGLPDIV